MDNLVVVEASNLNIGHSMVSAPIAEECRSLSEEFGKVLSKHIVIEFNMVARVLA